MCGVCGSFGGHSFRFWPAFVCAGNTSIPLLQAADVGVVQRKGYTPTQEIFEPYWKSLVASGEHQVESFTPQLGQALIWSANLIHGGSPVADPLKSRWSQVTHYFFEGCRHYTPMLSDWPEGPVLGVILLTLLKEERMETVLEKGKQSSEMPAVENLHTLMRGHFSGWFLVRSVVRRWSRLCWRKRSRREKGGCLLIGVDGMGAGGWLYLPLAAGQPCSSLDRSAAPAGSLSALGRALLNLITVLNSGRLQQKC